MTPKAHEHYLVGEKYSRSFCFPKEENRNTAVRAWGPQLTADQVALSTMMGSRRSSCRPCVLTELCHFPSKLDFHTQLCSLWVANTSSRFWHITLLCLPVHLWPLGLEVWGVTHREGSRSSLLMVTRQGIPIVPVIKEKTGCLKEIGDK